MGMRFLAGAARVEIGIPSNTYPVDGFVGVRDALSVRALILETHEIRSAVVSIELVSIHPALLADLREVVQDAVGVSADNLLIAVTHTFSAPHVFASEVVSASERTRNEAVGQAIVEAVRAAVLAAAEALRPARVSHGVGQATVNINREVPTADGWWLGANEAGPVDHSVGVLRIDDHDGAPIAFLVNYAAQSSIMHESITADGGALTTGDLAGSTSRYVESSYPDSAPVAIFLIGAAGDQAPLLVANRHAMDRKGARRRVDVGAAGFILVDLLGERLGAEVVRVSESLSDGDECPALAADNIDVTLPGQIPPRDFRELAPTHAYDFRPTPSVTAPAMLLRIGELAIAGVQVELCCETGLWIKQHSAFEHTFVATVANGGAKYMAPNVGYDRCTYAAMNSHYGRGAAERFAEQIVETLTRLASRTATAPSGPLESQRR